MTQADDHFSRWKNREEIAEAMIPMIGQLYRQRDVTIQVYSRSLVNKSVITILKTHRFVRHQMTWFRKLPGLQWFDMDVEDADTVERFAGQWLET